jgi:corrinoid protein of di/trimethylamine methyltransferase
MNKENSARRLREAIIRCEEREIVRGIAEEVTKSNVDPIDVIQNDLVLAMKEVGDRFERGEYFLTHMMLAAEAMEVATDILTQNLKGEERKALEYKTRKARKVVIGTVKGDIHDIGKNMVALLLRANGYGVFDLGKDVSPKRFVDEAEKVGADVIALSALLTVTRPFQADVISLLMEKNVRENFRVIVGGGPTSSEWAESIGADGWAPDASGAVRLIKQLFPD